MSAAVQPSKLVTLFARFNYATATAAGGAILLMMLAGAADVIATNLDLIGLPSRPIPSTNEFMSTMMVAAVFLGLALAQQRGGHIRVTVGHLVERRLGRPAKAAGHALHGLFYALIAWFGWATAAHAVATGEFAAGLFDFPVWPARLALAFGATAMALQCLIDTIGVYATRFRLPENADGPLAAG